MSGFDHLDRQLLASVRELADAPATETTVLSGEPAEEHAAPRGERSAGPVAAARRTRRRLVGSRRTLSLVLLGLVGAGTAAAAVATFTGQPSRPLAGEVARPADPARGIAAGTDHYRIGIEPKLIAGQAGWCSTASFSTTGGQRTGGRGCGPAGQRTNPTVAGGGTGYSVITDGGAQTPQQRRVSRFFSYAVVTSAVSAVRFPGGGLITPRPDPGLPNGWRVAMIVAPTEQMGWRYLGADGKPLLQDLQYRHVGRNQLSEPFDPLARTWAATTDCGALTMASVPEGLRLKRARRLRRDARGLPAQPGAFLSCASMELHTAAGAPYLAGVLVDAIDPSSARAPELPGTAPISDGRVESPDGLGSSRLTARRVGRAWLVVKGNEPALRRRLLRSITVHALG